MNSEDDKISHTIVSAKGVSLAYGDYVVLRDVTFNAIRGQALVVMGGSGCGKSTLLKWCNRMNDIVPIARATGSLNVGGRNILTRSTDVVDLRRQVGMVFQKANPFPKSIFDNVAYGVRLHYKTSRSELSDLVEWSLKKAALWDEVKDRLKRSALGLSGGQQQRLCIASNRHRS